MKRQTDLSGVSVRDVGNQFVGSGFEDVGADEREALRDVTPDLRVDGDGAERQDERDSTQSDRHLWLKSANENYLPIAEKKTS